MIVYSFTDAEGADHEITGSWFDTDMQRIDTEEESAASEGAAIGSYVALVSQHRTVDLDGYDAELLARWKITRTILPDPEPAPVLRTDSVFDFMYGRFTLAERIAIHASTDPVVQDFVRALAVIPRVELDATLTVQGVNYMEAQGLIAAGRAAQVLA